MSTLSQLQGRIGPVLAADGTFQFERLSKDSAQVIQSAHAKYFEAVSRGNCYAAMTAVTGVSIASLTVTTTGQFTLHNPIGSGKLLVIMRATMGYVSGTYGAGNLVYAVSPGITATTPTGTAITAKNLLCGGPASAAGVALTTSTITAPTPIRNFANLAASAAATALGPSNVTDDVDGEIQLLPGTGVTITGTTLAGTSPLVVFSMSWEEILMT